jgi:hypothetical protein
VIPNAVIHLLNEQPVIADLYELPRSGDYGLLCTNLRTMDGKRPVFIDRMDSVFFFPYLHIRFIEIAAAASGLIPVEEASKAAAPGGAERADAEEDLELDEEFLRKIREV